MGLEISGVEGARGVGNAGEIAREIVTALASEMVSSSDAGHASFSRLLDSLASDFGFSSSGVELATMLAVARLVTGAGVPALDAADGIYRNDAVRQAMQAGHSEQAKQMLLADLRTTLAALREMEIPERNLQAMTASGLAAGEILAAVRDNADLRNGRAQLEFAQLRQIIDTLHESLRNDGRTAHADVAMLAALGARLVPASNVVPGAWFDSYAQRLDRAEQRRLSEVHPEEHAERLLVMVPVEPDEAPNGASLGVWLLAAIVGAAALLVIVAHC